MQGLERAANKEYETSLDLPLIEALSFQGFLGSLTAASSIYLAST